MFDDTLARFAKDISMDSKIFFGITSIIFSFAQFTPYIRDILKRKTHPHAFSWFVWGLPCSIVFAAQVSAGAGPGAWATAFTTIACTLIFLLSLKYGERDLHFIDWICLLLALLALILWDITKDPLSAVVLITLSDVLGFGPTIRKSILKPEDETMSSYFIASIKWIFALFALNKMTLVLWLYPVSMIVANWFLVLVLMRKYTLKPST